MTKRGKPPTKTVMKWVVGIPDESDIFFISHWRSAAIAAAIADKAAMEWQDLKARGWRCWKVEIPLPVGGWVAVHGLNGKQKQRGSGTALTKRSGSSCYKALPRNRESGQQPVLTT